VLLMSSTSTLGGSSTPSFIASSDRGTSTGTANADSFREVTFSTILRSIRVR